MKISFLLTFFNQEKFVDTSMRSILAVKIPDEWEILVGDDGSTDATISKIQNYVDQYPEHIRLYTRSLEDKKQIFYRNYSSMNRLHLLDEATGDFFCLLDGDDWYFDTSFAKEAVDILNRESDISAVMYGYRCYSNNSYIGQNLTLPVSGRITARDYIRNGWYIPAGACVYRNCYDLKRRELLKEHAFFNDNQVVYNSFNYGDVYSIQRAIYGYRIHEDSAWHSLSPIQTFVEGALTIDVCNAVINEELREDIAKRGRKSVLQMYAFRNEIKTMDVNYRAEMRKFWQRYSPSPRYDLFCYEDLSPSEFRKMKKQIVQGRQWEVVGQYLKRWIEAYSVRIKKCMIPLINKLPYVRRLIAENDGLKKRVEELSSELISLRNSQ